MLDRVGLLRGVLFQDFCGLLLSLDDPDFQAVNGAGGDLGNDGFLLVGTTVYQAYGPDRALANKVRAKIDDSVAKAVRLREGSLPGLQRLVFLTPFDLTQEAHAYLQASATASSLRAESWGETKLAALLTKHPSVRKGFAEFLLPDLAADLREIRELLAEDATVDPIEEAFGPDWLPHIFVLQKPDAGTRELQAYAWFRVRIYSDALAHDSFEPEEEDAFLDLVRDAFSEDAAATLEPPTDDRVVVEHRGLDLSFHRRWGWWTTGVLGMAATLPDLTRPGMYSVADMALDILRVFGLLGQLARNGSARVVVDIDPFRLAPAWDLSDLRGRDRLAARLAGVLLPGKASEAHRTATRLEHSSTVASMVMQAEQLTGEIVVKAARTLHSSRIRKSEVVSCLRSLLDTYLKLQSR